MFGCFNQLNIGQILILWQPIHFYSVHFKLSGIDQENHRKCHVDFVVQE